MSDEVVDISELSAANLREGPRRVRSLSEGESLPLPEELVQLLKITAEWFAESGGGMVCIMIAPKSNTEAQARRIGVLSGNPDTVKAMAELMENEAATLRSALAQGGPLA